MFDVEGCRLGIGTHRSFSNQRIQQADVVDQMMGLDFLFRFSAFLRSSRENSTPSPISVRFAHIPTSLDFNKSAPVMDFSIQPQSVVYNSQASGVMVRWRRSHPTNKAATLREQLSAPAAALHPIIARIAPPVQTEMDPQPAHRKTQIKISPQTLGL